MELFKKTNIDFVAKRHIFIAFSSLLILAGVTSLWIKGGAKLGIDFTGGMLIQLDFEQPVPLDLLRGTVAQEGFAEAELQSFPFQNAVLIRLPVGKAEANVDAIAGRILASVQQKVLGNKGVVERAEFVGPVVGRHLASQASKAVFLSLFGIIIYVAFRFRSVLWGVSGVVALLHDVFATFGIFSILNKEVNLVIVAALLTIAGYSINDTIVIFDRMRENLRLYRKESLKDLINRSVNETLSRSIITNLTVFLAVAALYFLGGEVIHDFSFAMLFGQVVGTYSTIFIAAPIVYEWETRRQARLASLFAARGGKRHSNL